MTSRSTLCLALMLVTLGLSAIRPPIAGASRLKSLEKAADVARSRPLNQSEISFHAPAQTAEAVARFRLQSGGTWRVIHDELTGAPALLEGSGLPWIEKSGDGMAMTQASDRQVLEAKARALIADHPDLFGGVGNPELRLIDSATGPVLNYLYFLDFQWTHHGIPVEGAHAFFRLNHGNLVQFGSEMIAAPRIAGLPPRPRIGRDEAAGQLWEYLGVVPAPEQISEPGRLLVVPATDSAGRLDYRLVWVFGFKHDGEPWEGRVDAQGGVIHAFFSTLEFGHIQGAAYTLDNNAGELSLPFAFANYSGTTTYADAAGNFPGTAGTSTLTGRYVRIVDSCGAISKAADAAGLIDFGNSNGTNCTAPATGGAGNTHSARTQYWNVTAIKLKALAYLPTNNWLGNQLRDNVNLTAADSPYCPGNAWWDGTTVNFCVSGFGYANTGELPGVSLHEWGHGMDRNDGNGSSPDNGSGETYGDVSAALQTHDSCIGDGFASGNCSGYGDGCQNCSGVRDIDYANHQSNTPHTADNFIRPRCPASASYRGPCGDEGHCESYVSSEAVWDTGVRDLTSAAGGNMDQTTAWQTLDRYWYASRPSATAAFSCTAGATYTSNGCGGGSLFSVFRVVDDCDGNLANGTPHAAAIWNAFNRHAIGCSSVVNTNQTGCCPALAAPSLSGSPGNNIATLNWNDTANATRYKLYRNSVSCTAGFALVATVNDPTITYLDTPLSNGTTYYYRVQAFGASDACSGPMSNCVTVTPVAGPACSAPTGLANNTAVDAGTACTATGVRVTWTAPSAWGDTSGTRTWTVLRNAVAIAAGPCLGPLAVGTLTCIDSTAVAGTAYTYSVRANNGCGMSTTTAGVSATDVTSVAPSGVNAPTVADPSACTTSGINVTWVAPIWGGAAGTYTILRDGVAVVGGACAGSIPAGTLTCLDTTAAAGAHTYQVRATNGCALVTTSVASGSVTDLAGAVPSGFANNTAVDINACTATGNSVTWTAPTWNDNASGTRTYTVLRGGVAVAAGPCSGTQAVGTVTCNDTSAVAGTAYTYTVRANNGCALQTTTTPGAAATDMTDSTAPGSPLDTIAKAAPNMNFSWLTVPTTANYRTYSAPSLPATWTLRNTTATLGWSNAVDLGAAGSFFYTTTAVDACGNASPQ